MASIVSRVDTAVIGARLGYAAPLELAMYQPLVACPSCHRHIRTTEAQCPFCAAAIAADLAARAIPSATSRMSRAAAFLFGASIALGCGSEITSEESGSASGDPSGGTTSSSSSSSSSSSGAGGSMEVDAGLNDDGGAAAMYGLPPPLDAGPDDDGGGSADYGAPPLPDGGSNDMDGGGNQPLYGAPPPME